MNLNRVSSSAAAEAANDASPRLKNAAHQFEASLLTELLKPMHGDGWDDDDGDEDESAEGSMREYATEAMAQCLSEHGGIGIARMVLAKLGPLEAARGKEEKSGEKNRLARSLQGK